MKFLRFGPAGEEKPGVLDGNGRIRDLSGEVGDISGDVLSAAGIARLSALDLSMLPLVEGEPRLGCPVAGIGKFIAVGLNYADHAAEANMALPSEPVIFSKATSCIVGPNDDVVLPPASTKGDWEVELGIVIGKTARYVSREDAFSHVAGYCLVNDVSEREYQLERGGTWDKGKGFDTFGPIGPYLVTAEEVPDPHALDMWLDLNGQRMQSGSTRTMIFDVASLVSYISRIMTLFPGDVITTGTPPGVGMGQRPEPIYLKAGDVMELGIDKLGRQRQRVRAWA
ncbi:fumarylacetoacetate hydrolase family protein [Xanthobacter autotrophicus DSM 431]|uniref:fumarylacetoacetate hydrolase family protein n=1 Tax=Xanthobacter nonsaccharivorans TaxID=3119912 RepID=UPI00372B0818